MMNVSAHKHILTLEFEDFPPILIPYHFLKDDETVFADRLEVDMPVVVARLGDSTITDQFNWMDGFLAVRRKWNIAGSGEVRVCFGVQVRLTPLNWVAPAVIYDGNGMSPGRFPRRGAELGLTFMEDKCAVPSCSFIQNREHHLGVFTSPAANPEELSSVNTYSAGEFTGLTITLPGAESSQEPAGIRLTRLLAQPETRFWSLDKHLTYERSFYIALGPAGPDALRGLIRKAWKAISFDPAPRADWSEHVSQKVFHLVHHFFIERADAIGFVESLSRNMFPKKATLWGGGVGGNVEAAACLYRFAVEADMPGLRRIALDTADFFLGGLEDPDVFHTAYRLGARKWAAGNSGKPHHYFLRAVSGMVESYMRFHAAAKARDDANPRWLNHCRHAAGLLTAGQSQSGGFPSSPPHTMPADSGGSLHTAFAVSALLAVARETKDSALLDSACKGAEFLAAQAWERCYADPETGLPSRETAIETMRALLTAYKDTDRQRYLQAAELAAEFVLSGLFCHNVALEKTTPLGARRFRTQGGSPEFTAAQSLDWLGLRAAPGMLRLWRITGDELWKRAAGAMLEFAGQLEGPQPGSNIWGAMTGWQPAVLMQTAARQALNENVPWGGFAEIESAVPTATLSALFDIRDEFPEFVTFTPKQFQLDAPAKSAIGKALFHFGSYVNIFR